MSEYIAKASIEPRDYRVVFLIQRMSGQPASCPLVCTDVIPVLKHYALRTKDSQSVHSIFVG